MKESIEKLFTKMKEDKEFAEKILQQKEREKVIEIAKAEGINITLEDIDEANAIIQKSVNMQQSQTEGELSEEELENVAGGTLVSAVLSIVSVVLSVTGTISGVVSVSVSATVTAGVSAGISASQE